MIPAPCPTLGLTGSIGSGKSTAGRFLEALGWTRIDTDTLVHELYRDPEVQTLIKERWGVTVTSPEGTIDRGKIAAIVFNSPVELGFLESLLHPLVRHLWQRRSRAASGPVLVEVPLLFEKRLEKHFDFTVCIAVSEATQHQRLLKRGEPAESSKARIARQLPVAEKIARSDFAISNEGSLDFLKQQLLHLQTHLSS